jgi:hypothetical protein
LTAALAQPCRGTVTHPPRLVAGRAAPSSALEHGALRHQAGLEVAPQRHEQLARQRRGGDRPRTGEGAATSRRARPRVRRRRPEDRLLLMPCSRAILPQARLSEPRTLPGPASVTPWHLDRGIHSSIERSRRPVGGRGLPVKPGNDCLGWGSALHAHPGIGGESSTGQHWVKPGNDKDQAMASVR